MSSHVAIHICVANDQWTLQSLVTHVYGRTPEETESEAVQVLSDSLPGIWDHFADRYDQNRNSGTFVIILNDFYICSMIIPLSSCLLHIAGALGASITFNSSSKLNYPIFTTWQCVGKLLFWIPQELYTNYTLKTITYNIIIGFTYQAQAVDIISVSSNSLRDLGWDQASDCPLKLCITHSQSRTRTVFTVKHDMTPKLWALLVYFCHCRHFQCQ